MSQTALLDSTSPLELPSPVPAPAPGDAPPRGPAKLPRLEIPGYDLTAALMLERALGISHLLSQILVRRGLTDPAAAREFLDPSESHDPGAFGGIDRAVGLVRRHIAAGSRITVHGDYDVDGICATAIMVRALRSLGADAGWFLPNRIDDGYGVSAATVERLAAAGTGLLITVDCGITAVEEVAAARAAGIDVIVCDHHAPRADGILPDAPIVHPAVCDYPCRDLCGAAVAHKLATALGAGTVDEDLELVAMATIADLVPLQGENRRLVRAGLSVLACTAKPGLRALMSVSRTDPSSLDAQAVAFRLAPRINAAGRLTRADAGLELLLTEDERRAAEIATELDAVNAERRAIEQRIGWEAEAQVAELGERPALVLAAEGWHPGVIGIVASRVVERHHRPAILIALDGELGSGSGRSIPGFDLLGALHVAAAQMERYGGHRMAAGLTIRRDRVLRLRAIIEEHAASLLTPELLQPLERVDAIAAGPDLGLAAAEELDRMEPCGLGNARARLLVPGARLGNVRTMGEGRHARFSVASGGCTARAVAFGCDGRPAGADGEPHDATFRLERNVWNGAVEPRLVLRHAQPCAPAPIEVVGEPEHYLEAMLAELQAEAIADRRDDRRGGASRTVLDRRGQSPLATLADAVAAAAGPGSAGPGSGSAGPESGSAGPVSGVLAVCADVPRRLAGLQARAGGFGLIAYHQLARTPHLAGRYPHLVALDPPACPEHAELLALGSGFTHLGWSEAELRFAVQMHELEYQLRGSLAALYRALRDRGRVVGEELERLLRGDGPHARPARLSARLIRVLAELGLVSLDRDLPALAVASDSRTELERSPAYRSYSQRYEDGRRFLTHFNPLPSV